MKKLTSATRSAFVFGIALLIVSSCSTNSKIEPSVTPEVKNFVNEETTKVSDANQSLNTEQKEEITLKPLPELGDSYEQMQFRVEDNNAIINGTPRPAFPETLAILAGNPPSYIDVCNLPYSALIKKMFDNCIEAGMSYERVSNIVGYEGDLKGDSGALKTYFWNGGEGGMSATFKNNQLISKVESGLK